MTTANTLATLGNGPAFSVYSATTQTLSSNVWLKVSLNTKVFDTNSNFDATTNYRFTPTVAGYYQVNGAIYFRAAANADQVMVSIYKNGSEFRRGNNSAMTDLATTQVVSELIYMNGTTDYLELYGYSYNGTTVQMYYATSFATSYMSASLVRGT